MISSYDLYINKKWLFNILPFDVYNNDIMKPRYL